MRHVAVELRREKDAPVTSFGKIKMILPDKDVNTDFRGGEKGN